jgi:hypothetical protein
MLPLSSRVRQKRADMNRFWLAFLIAMAATANAVPSHAALNPRVAALAEGRQSVGS